MANDEFSYVILFYMFFHSAKENGINAWRGVAVPNEKTSDLFTHFLHHFMVVVFIVTIIR